MKLGMPILYEFDTIEENLKLAKKLNLDFVELNLNFEYCRKELEEQNVKKMLQKYNLEATLHFYDEADFGSYEEVVNAYLILLERYAKLGKGFIKKMNIHNNYGPVVTISGNKNYIYEKEYNQYIERVVNKLHQAAHILKENDIEMIIENVDGANSAPFLMKNFLRFQKEGFHFNLDIGHDNVEKDCFYHLIKENNMPLSELHFHDGNRSKCHLTLGTGTIDLKTYKELAEKNNAYVLLEVKCSEDLIASIPYYKNL